MDNTARPEGVFADIRDRTPSLRIPPACAGQLSRVFARARAGVPSANSRETYAPRQKYESTELLCALSHASNTRDRMKLASGTRARARAARCIVRSGTVTLPIVASE